MLRCNYREDDLPQFMQDLRVLTARRPAQVLRADRRALRRKNSRTSAIATLCIMILATAFLLWAIMEVGMRWYWLPVVQSVMVLVFFGVSYLHISFDDDPFLIYREADRRGIRYTLGTTELYQIMNAMNRQYNTLGN